MNVGPLTCGLVNTPDNVIGGKFSNQRICGCPCLRTSGFLTLYGHLIEFNVTPGQLCVPKPTLFIRRGSAGLDLAVSDFQCRGIIEPCLAPTGPCFYSIIFPGLERDGSIRVILNLCH